MLEETSPDWFNLTGEGLSDVTSILDVEEKRITPLEVWGYGFLFVTFINLSSIFGIIFFPLMKKKYYPLIMRTMIGLAIGSLSGSALFHLIPQALGLEESGTDYLMPMLFVWISIWAVMLLECIIKIALRLKETRADEKEAAKADAEAAERLSIATALKENGLEKHSSKDENGLRHSHSTFSLNRAALSALAHDHGPKKTKIHVAWIIIIGDGFHNFVDGVAIGAAFTHSFYKGAIIALAMVCEEFPHELGDFAILINSGLTVKRALLFNFASACTCYLGLILGIILGGQEWSTHIFAFAAGIFLYVSLSDMVPEITSLIDDMPNPTPCNAWRLLINHNIGILIGVTILFILAIYQP